MADRTWNGATSGAWTTAANWREGVVPVALDNVRIPAGSATITSGLNQSAVALGYVIIEKGHTTTIGVAPGAAVATYLQINCTRFECHGSGQYWIDLGTSAIAPQVTSTASPAAGERGLYLKGTALTTLTVLGGNVGLAVAMGEVSTVTTVRVTGSGANVWVGSGVTLTTFYQTAGDSEIRSAATTITCYGGNLKTKETGAVTTLNAYGGTILPESSGTITTLTADGESTGQVFVDFSGSGVARTVTTLKQNPGSRVKLDPAVVTVTTRSAPDHPSDITSVAA